MLQQPVKHFDAIFHIHEIAERFPVTVLRVVRLEQADGKTLFNVRIDLADYAFHVALVVFVRAVHVEKLDAGDRGKTAFTVRPHVKELLGPAVGIQGPEPDGRLDAVGKTHRAVAIGCGTAGIDETHAPFHRTAAEQFTVFDVVVHQKIDIALRRGRTGTQMDDAVYFPVQAVFIQNLPEFIPVEIIGEFPVDEIVPFFAGGEIVHHQNVVYPHPVQFPDHGTADETGAARNNIHVNSPVIPPACPSVRGRQEDCLNTVT